MVGRDQYGYIRGPYYTVKPGPKPPREHDKVESKKLHKLGRFPKLRVAVRAAGAARKAFSMTFAYEEIQRKGLPPEWEIALVRTLAKEPGRWQ